MENEKTQESPFAKASPFVKTSEDKSEDRQLLQEIWKYTRRTERYMRWQLYITLVLVVLPLLAMVFIIPMVIKSLGSTYGGALLQ